MINSICGEDGVPDLIQDITYLGRLMAFEVLFFNDKRALFYSLEVCSSIKVTHWGPPSRKQWIEAESNIRKMIDAYWVEYFPASNSNSDNAIKGFA